MIFDEQLNVAKAVGILLTLSGIIIGLRIGLFSSLFGA